MAWLIYVDKIIKFFGKASLGEENWQENDSSGLEVTQEEEISSHKTICRSFLAALAKEVEQTRFGALF